MLEGNGTIVQVLFSKNILLRRQVGMFISIIMQTFSFHFVDHLSENQGLKIVSKR